LEVVQRSGVSYLHGSLTNWRGNGGGSKGHASDDSAALEANVCEALQMFRLGMEDPFAQARR
jgi:hypothetical protein